VDRVAEASRRGVVNLATDGDDADAVDALVAITDVEAVAVADVGGLREATGRVDAVDDTGVAVGPNVGRAVGEVGAKENDTRGVDAAEVTTDKEPDDERKMGRMTVAGATTAAGADVAEGGGVTEGDDVAGLVTFMVAVDTVGVAISFGIADEVGGNEGDPAAAAAARRVSRRLADTLRPNAGPRGVSPVEGGITTLRDLPLLAACRADTGVSILVRDVVDRAGEGEGDAVGGVAWIEEGVDTVGVGRAGGTGPVHADAVVVVVDGAAAETVADLGLGLTRPDELGETWADRPRCIMGEGVESVEGGVFWALPGRDDEVDFATGRARAGARGVSLSSVVVLRGSEEDDDE
jgi:hypothetical protein